MLSSRAQSLCCIRLELAPFRNLNERENAEYLSIFKLCSIILFGGRFLLFFILEFYLHKLSETVNYLSFQLSFLFLCQL